MNPIDETRTLLKQLETRARKRFGQHFLVKPEIVQRIVRGARVREGDRVVEIGPGLGVLTRELLANGARVLAVELDRDLAAFIRETLPEVELIETDAARVDWHATVEPGAKVVANLPYNVGTKVLMQMLRTGDAGVPVFQSVTVMLQKEVVDRLMAAPGTRKYGALTVEAQARASAVFVLSVEPDSFHPPPKVRSSVVRMDVRPEGPQTGGVEPAAFDRVVHAAFSQRRKTLVNSLSSLYGKDRARAAVAEAELDPGIRAERLSLAAFRALAGALEGPAVPG